MTATVEHTLPRSAILRRFSAEAADDATRARGELERALVEACGPLVEPLPGRRALVSFVVTDTPAQPFVSSQLFPDGEERPMLPLAGSDDIWWAETTVPADAATVYQYASRPSSPPSLEELEDPETLGRFLDDVYDAGYADPRNPERCWPIAALMTRGAAAAPPKEKWQSIVRLPEARRFTHYDGSPPSGRLETLSVASSILGNTRDVTVWTPAEAAGRPLPLLVLLDGECFLLGMQAPLIFENLVARGEVPGFVAAFVHNATRFSRMGEYPCNPGFAAFLADELVPDLRRRYPSLRHDATAVGGYSYGGLAACWAGFERPDVFGSVLSLSASLWWGSPVEWLIRRYETMPRRPLRFWIEVGTLEIGPLGLDDPAITMLSVSRRFRDVLAGRGYEVGYRERAGGHDFVNWREGLVAGVRELLAGPEDR